VLVRHPSSPVPTPTAGINRPRLLFPYDANICFSCFKGILQLFLMDVAYIASVSEACYKRLLKMFHLFPRVCCNSMFQMFQLFQSYVAVSVFSCCNCSTWMLHMFHIHVASVCPKCLICFKYMLHSSVSCCKCIPPALVSMKACRASHGHRRAEAAHVAAGGVGKRHRPKGVCGRGRGESSGRPERDGRRTGVEEAKMSHPSSVGSRSKACGSDTMGNGAGLGGKRVTWRSTRGRPDGHRHPYVSAAEE
jgi:hypothetical protein